MLVENVALELIFGPFASRKDAITAYDTGTLDEKIPPAGSVPDFCIYGETRNGFPVDGLSLDKITSIRIGVYHTSAKSIVNIGGSHYLLVNVLAANIEADSVIHDSSDVNEALDRLSDAMLGPDNDDDRPAKILSIITDIVENVTAEGRDIIAAIAAYEKESEYSDEAKRVCEIMFAPKVESQKTLPLGEV